jgi:hypothetical protein
MAGELWLEDASPTSQAALVAHAEHAGRLAALAIGALDRDAPSVPEAIADCLAHLLVVCVLADEAGHHLTPEHTDQPDQSPCPS